MRLVIIRHGDPDYEHDTLTETGKKEAEALAERVSKWDVKAFYVSPMGRARDTAAYTLQKMGRTAETLPWLREFTRIYVHRPDIDTELRIPWDWVPADWTGREVMFDKDLWKTDPVFSEAGVGEEYDEVVRGLDLLLEKHGYRRNGYLYDAIRSNTDTIVFFCHFGISTVLLSHLIHCSPMVLWHGTMVPPTGITEIVTEERRDGVAAWRAVSIGDTSHLYAAGLKPGFSGLFRECYADETHRKDDYFVQEQLAVHSKEASASSQ